MTRIFAVALTGVLLGTGSSLTAATVDLSKLPPPSSKQGVTYEKDMKPIFEASCVRCHGSEKPKAGLRLDSLEGVLKGSKEGKVVSPGNSEKSPIVIAVSRLDPEMAMPPKPRAPKGPGKGGPAKSESGHGTSQAPNSPPRPMGPPPKPLTPEQVGLVRAWIDQGAK